MAKETTVPITAESLIRVLAGLTAGDLQDVDAKIAAKQAERDQATAAIDAELRALADVRKLVARRLGLEPDKRRGGRRKKATASPPPNGERAAAPAELATQSHGMMLTRRGQVAKLLGSRGPLSSTIIAKELGIPDGSITAVLRCELFEPIGDRGGFRLTELGRKELLGK